MSLSPTTSNSSSFLFYSPLLPPPPTKQHSFLFSDGKHVIAAIKVCALAEKLDGVNHMSLVMGSFVDKLTFKDMFVVLKDKEEREQVRHLIL
ncbi:hypothetical protein MTR_3g100440 [Medicago truncatula]|uniref:Uncharacterized protein n=1 Tax=Medicago truncatula TaxID=3880 RepID=G7J549_MEDTR|nr:hypothetical protein MTR_3g100440 [Medicago truncatula]